MVEVVLTEGTANEGLDFMKELGKKGVRLQFEEWDDVVEFKNHLNEYNEDQREGISYRAQKEPSSRRPDRIETVPANQ
jgi:hypothetical protein